MRRGGVVLGARGQLHFLPALAVLQIVAVPPITRLPGAPPELAGVAQIEGGILPVVDLRAREEEAKGGMLLVCSYLGEPLGVIVAQVLGVGHWDVAQPDAVLVGEERVRALDLGKIYGRLQAGTAFRA